MLFDLTIYLKLAGIEIVAAAAMLSAGVPIALAYCDFIKKEAGIGKMIYPSGDIDKDMREIMAFYKPLIDKGKYPELSSIDMDYA